MEFLQSEWFMWVVIIFVIGGGIAYQVERATEDGFEWDVAWHGLKQVFLVLFSMFLLPLILIFGRTKEKK